MARALMLLLVLSVALGATAGAGVTGSLYGYVTGSDGKPLADAIVFANSAITHVRTRTDANGLYAFAGLAPGYYVVYAQHAGYYPVALSQVPIEADSEQSLQLRLIALMPIPPCVAGFYYRPPDPRFRSSILGMQCPLRAEALIKPGTTSDVYVIHQTFSMKSNPASPNGALLFVPGVVPSFSAPFKQ